MLVVYRRLRVAMSAFFRLLGFGLVGAACSASSTASSKPTPPLPVRGDGFLGWVQPTGAAPCSGPQPLGADIVPNFEDFGVGCFLLAGGEMVRLGRQLRPATP
jgi:hypothetical protein